MDKFLTSVELENFSLDAEGDFVDEQTFQNYMHKVPIWDFLKVDYLEYQKIEKISKNCCN